MSRLPTHRIGDYIVRYLPEGKVWIEHDDGEGMEADAEELETYMEEYLKDQAATALDNFFNDNY